MLDITYKVTPVQFRAFRTCMRGVSAFLFTKVVTAKENVRILELFLEVAWAHDKYKLWQETPTKGEWKIMDNFAVAFQPQQHFRMQECSFWHALETETWTKPDTQIPNLDKHRTETLLPSSFFLFSLSLCFYFFFPCCITAEGMINI